MEVTFVLEVYKQRFRKYSVFVRLVDAGFVLALPLHHRDLELDSVGG